jgi:membrane-associated protein
MNAESLISYGGLLIVFLSVFGQTGLFFCFFLPSGGLMFTAGVLTANGSFQYHILVVCALCAVAAVAGNVTGYWIGRRTGYLLKNKKDTGMFRRQYLVSAETFYKKYGATALTVGIFLPLIRTFAPIVAGMIGLDFRRFLLFVVIGSIAYGFSFVLAGYLIGSMPFLKPYLKYFVVVIVVTVTIPVVIRIVKEFRKSSS